MASPRRRKALGTRLPFISFYASDDVFRHFRALLSIIWCYYFRCFFFFAIKAKVEAHNIFLLSWVVKKKHEKRNELSERFFAKTILVMIKTRGREYTPISIEGCLDDVFVISSTSKP